MSKIEARLRERDEARKAAVAARRLEKEKDSKAEETSQFFTEKFSLQKTGSAIIWGGYVNMYARGSRKSSPFCHGPYSH